MSQPAPMQSPRAGDGRATGEAQPGWRILIHWTTAVVIVVGVSAVFAREGVAGRGARDALLSLHRSCGLVVLLLTLARIGAAPWSRTSAVDVSPALRWAARALHAGLYMVLAGLGVVGWSLASARGQVVALLGLLPLPALLDRDRDLAETLHEVHEVLAFVLLGMLVLHVAAALWHHFRIRDGVLRAMTPRWMRRPTT